MEERRQQIISNLACLVISFNIYHLLIVLFLGSTTQKPAGSLFGNTTSNPSLFGGSAATSTQPIGGGLFGGGTSAQPTTSLFGKFLFVTF